VVDRPQSYQGRSALPPTRGVSSRGHPAPSLDLPRASTGPRLRGVRPRSPPSSPYRKALPLFRFSGEFSTLPRYPRQRSRRFLAGASIAPRASARPRISSLIGGRSGDDCAAMLLKCRNRAQSPVCGSGNGCSARRELARPGRPQIAERDPRPLLRHPWLRSIPASILSSSSEQARRASRCRRGRSLIAPGLERRRYQSRPRIGPSRDGRRGRVSEHSSEIGAKSASLAVGEIPEEGDWWRGVRTRRARGAVRRGPGRRRVPSVRSRPRSVLDRNCRRMPRDLRRPRGARRWSARPPVGSGRMIAWAGPDSLAPKPEGNPTLLKSQA